MADLTASGISVSQNPVLRILRIVWDGFVYLGECSGNARILNEYAQMSDEDLAKRGLTREQAVKKILADIYHI